MEILLRYRVRRSSRGFNYDLDFVYQIFDLAEQ